MYVPVMYVSYYSLFIQFTSECKKNMRFKYSRLDLNKFCE